MMQDAVHPDPAIERRLRAIYALHRKHSDFRLHDSPYTDLLAALGDPHLRLPPVIHVAGTNGKGSTVAFMRAIYEAAGYRVHVYTSPHLLRFNERIVLAGRTIGDDALAHYLDTVERANDRRAVTFFEYTTAMAFRAFADTPADICILETGLGGRLDCTNIVPAPAATVITAIGYDHMDYLGASLDLIAGEKAGIMKPGAPCVIAPQPYADTVNPVFQAHAKTVSCPLIPVSAGSDNLALAGPLGLSGPHQRNNAATAVALVETLADRFPVQDDAIVRGLAAAHWPGRMERITQGKAFDAAPAGCALWFDCGHNADGARAIAAVLEEWKRERPDSAIHLLLGLSADKDAGGFAAPLAPWIDSVTCLDLPGSRNPQNAHDLKAKLARPDARTAPDAVSALSSLSCGTGDTILICGSMYLYGALW